MRSTLSPERKSVPIRFHVPAHGLERLAFAYSPLLEAVLSLHVLTEPKHHPLQHQWVRQMRALPAGLRRRVADFGFVYRRTMPDFVAPSPEAGFRSFEEELVQLQELDAETLGLEFLRPLYDHGGRRDPGLLEDADVRARALRQSASLGASSELAALIFDDPHALARSFAELLHDYWEAAFAAEWERLEPRLAAAVTDAGRVIAADGVYALLQGLSRRLRVDPAREEFGLDIPHDHRVEVTETNRLLLVPSAFVWPHVRVNCDEPWPLSVIYPASFVVADARPRIPSADLVRVLRAVADDTRLRALRLIAERPRSTQELAPLVGITEAGLSKHLRQLAQAGVLTTRREGYYVLYSVDTERLSPLSETLLSFLQAES
jgi:DNA-binding transcriptional ArsR family regulator